MPDQFTWNQFGGGWKPSADAINGPKDCLLQMDNVELDKTGALSLIGGTTVVGSAYTYNAHTLFSNVISGTRYDYVADTNGGVLRNGGSITTGGSTTNAAFGVAFDFTLVLSGTKRLKDTGAATTNLGIASLGPVVAVIDGIIWTTGAGLNNPAVFVSVLGTWAQTGVALYFSVDPVSLASVVQTYTLTSPTVPMDMTVLAADNSLTTAISGLTPSDFDIIYTGLSFIYQAGANPSGSAATGDLSNVQAVTLDILLVAPDNIGSVVSDYFSYTWVNPGIAGADIQIPIQRGQFTRVGLGNQDWHNVYGFRLTVVANSAIANVVIDMPGAFYGATLNGLYEYAQVNVNSSNSYTAKSALGSSTSKATVSNNTVRILPDISGIDSQVNQIWVYRRGGNLEQWYRVLVFTSGNWTVPQYDYLTDSAAQTIGLTIDSNLVPINSTGIADPILDLIGPIEGRWFYFTRYFMYPSDINDPDLVDVSIAIRTTGSTSELFLWARRISDSSVLVGTSRDIYLLTGTFITLPDGTVDIYYRSVGCKHPPITFDATFSSGQVFYLAADGWRSIDSSGANPLIVVPATDRLYRGITAYGYSASVQIIPGSARFPVVLARNRLWCSITGQSRIEVLDSARGYWRNFAIGKGDCLAICSTQDGGILGFFASDKKLRLLDVQSSLLIDGSTNQTVTVLSPVFDGGTPHQRKDTASLIVRANTGGRALTIAIIDNTNTTNTLATVTTSTLLETIVDVSQVVAILKTFQFKLSGTFSGLTVDDLTLSWETRPLPVTFKKVYNQNFGNSSKKRLRVWPVVLDSGGRDVTFTGYVDSASSTIRTLNTTDKTTVNVLFTDDVFGIDYGYTLYCASGTFEPWEQMPPDLVQTLPIARRYDQVGPEELFRYGRIKQMEIRILPIDLGNLAGALIQLPYVIKLNDNQIITASLTVKNGYEQSYFVGMPQIVGGQIVRIELGPTGTTSFTFHRFYIRLQVAKSGKDTDLEWVTLGAG